MKIFPDQFENNPVLRLFGGAFILLGVISVLLSGIAVLEQITTAQTTESTTLAFIKNGQADTEVQKIEPAAGETQEESIVIVR